MQFSWSLLQSICLVPAIAGSIYSILCLLAVWRFRTQPRCSPGYSFSKWPGVTILKPVRGLEKNQEQNLRSACLQDYPEFQVVFSVQDPDDPALPLLKKIGQAFGSKRVSVVIGNRRVGPNGKINNLLGALPYAQYDTLVISDSDVHLKPDYLKAIIAPLADPNVGCVCTLYKATHADRWFEKMELLTLNADFVPSVIFASVTGASKFCLGSSVALRCSSLKEIGGFETLADYLTEDYEMGRRLWTSGKRVVVVPYFVETVVDLEKASRWWNHQVCWDQKTRAAQPAGFFATLLIRSVPFALLFAASRLADAGGLLVLGGVMGLRLATAAVILGWGLQDREGLRNLALLPLRDLTSIISWLLAFTKKTVSWRGAELMLGHDGRLTSREGTS
ncbi:MAG TPA: bacteriohopanetetrol glucosamine biosynthesis glycosyltransferase HpnI [Thermodesulfobacteriota bacterium]|nr:bacteriohopanetetrol glucosamine biosynthesis glycosyltransferase HpnI [Thermodesulfobacteriota bacterium]